MGRYLSYSNCSSSCCQLTFKQKPWGQLAPNATQSHLKELLSTGFIGTFQHTSRILADCCVELRIITP